MKNILLFILGTTISFLLYLLLSFLSLPLAKNLIIDFYNVKDYINSNTPQEKKRLLIMSASDGMYGIDGNIINAHSPYYPINYAMTYGVGIALEYRISKLISSSQPQDTILLPLNFGFYEESSPIADYTYYQNILSWGNTQEKQILIQQPPLFIETLCKTPPSRILTGILYQIHHKLKNQTQRLEEVKNAWNQKNHLTEFTIYNLDQYGSLMFHPENKIKQGSWEYLNKSPQISDYFIQQISRLIQYAKDNNITLIFTYPPTIKNAKFDLENPLHYQKIQKLKQQLKQYGITLMGDPKRFQFPIEFFYDTEYHLNSSGAKAYTQELIEVLKQSTTTPTTQTQP